MRKMVGLSLVVATTVTGAVSIAGLLGLLPGSVQASVVAAVALTADAAAHVPQITCGMDPMWAWAGGILLVSGVVARLVFYCLPRP